MSGVVLGRHEFDYTDLNKIGKITIEYDWKSGVTIIVDGFEFDNESSCRDHDAKALAWARDVLDAALQAEILIPGGQLGSVSGISQEKLDAENQHDNQRG